MTNPTMARALLEARLDGRDSVALDDASRILANSGFQVGANEVARILRSMDFLREGWSGSGYDRTPFYRRVPHG